MEFVDEKSEYFVKSNPSFKKACSAAFERIDKNNNGKIEGSEAASCVHDLFSSMQSALNDAGIKLAKLSPEDVQKLFEMSDADGSNSLTAAEFETFYSKVLRIAAVRCAAGAVRKYGLGIVCGVLAVKVAKGMIRRTPLVGLVSKPFMGLLKPLIVGPVLGVAAVYGLNKGDVLLLEKKLFHKEHKA